MYIYFLLIINGLPFLAPLFLKLSEISVIFIFPAKLVYLVYSFFCHQFHHRSVHLFDFQVAWCTRDMGIWLGMLTGAVLVRYFGFRGFKWYWVIPLLIPIALDGGGQTVATIFTVDLYGPTGDPLYISNNLIRFTTGAIAGLGTSLWLSNSVLEAFEEGDKKYSKRLLSWLKKPRHWLVAGTTFLILVYAALVGMWSMTSTEYQPVDLLDSGVKTPKEDFFQRRANGVCPTEGEDLFAWDCWLNR